MENFMDGDKSNSLASEVLRKKIRRIKVIIKMQQEIEGTEDLGQFQKDVLWLCEKCKAQSIELRDLILEKTEHH